MKRKSALSAGLKGKCPQCRKGDMFTHGPFVLSKITSMPNQCEECGLQFEIEPGFYFGAMYVSYGFSVGLLLFNTLIIYHLFSDPDVWVYLLSVSISSILLYPLIFRYSRIIFLHVFGGINYNPDQNETEPA